MQFNKFITVMKTKARIFIHKMSDKDYRECSSSAERLADGQSSRVVCQHKIEVKCIIAYLRDTGVPPTIVIYSFCITVVV